MTVAQPRLTGTPKQLRRVMRAFDQLAQALHDVGNPAEADQFRRIARAIQKDIEQIRRAHALRVGGRR